MNSSTMSSFTSNLTQTSTTSSYRYLPTEACNPSYMPQITFNSTLNFPSGSAYCQVNFPYQLDNLKSCCGGGVVQVWQNCTQYCKTNKDLHSFSTCVSDT